MVQKRSHWPDVDILCRGDWSRVTDFSVVRVIISSFHVKQSNKIVPD